MDHKHRNQWKCICAGMLALIFVLFVTRCYWQRKNGQNNSQVHQASDEFWQHVQEEIEEQSEVFSNQDNAYCITPQAEGEEMINVLTQQKPDGTLVQNHVVNQLESLMQVTNAYVYYTTWESVAGFRVFWCVPIEKTESGDQLIWESKEALLQNIRDISYITDSYVIYEADEGIYKLDLQKKEKLPVTVDNRQLSGSVVHCRDRKTVDLDGKLFVLGGSNMYSLEPGSASVKQIYTGASWKDEDIFYKDAYLVSDGNSICFTCDNETIWQNRQGEEQAVCAITQENFLEKLEKFGLKQGKEFQKYCISELIFYQERIYFLLRDANADPGDGKMCLLSAPISDLSKIQNESALTDYLNAWATGANSADTVSNDVVMQAMYVYKPDRIAGIVDDKLILESMRKSAASGMVYREYCVAYDIASNQVLERSGIRKVIY